MHESGHHNEAKVVTMIIKWRVEMYLRILYFQFKVLSINVSQLLINILASFYKSLNIKSKRTA